MTIAWLFPGQGAQAVGMGKDVFDGSPAARAVFEAGDRALGELLSGETVSNLCFSGPAPKLAQTANTQPAIVVTSAALVAAIRERYPELAPPACAAGHSLGEYSALVAAGALTIEHALRICRIRGQAMQEAVPEGQGAMAAVMGMGVPELAELCRAIERRTPNTVVAPANFNAPGQTVIAGNAEAVALVSVEVKAAGGKAIPLKVSAPFHCSLMAPAKEAVASALGRAEIGPPRFDVMANVDAAPKPSASAIVEALVSQIDSPVQWCDTIAAICARGVTHAIEIGPGRVLAGLCKRIDKSLAVLSVSDMKSIEKISEFIGLKA